MRFKKYFILIVLGLLILNSAILASPFNVGVVPNSTINGTLKNPIDKVYGSILLILQIASVAGVIITGLRYMFASSDKKSEIKNSMILLVIGLTIVFSAATIITFIRDAFVQVVT